MSAAGTGGAFSREGVSSSPAAALARVEGEILALERAALERWGRGDPAGFVEISAPDVTYFDPFLLARLDGRAALERYYASLAGKVQVDGYELLNPAVRVAGDAAVLTFNYVSWRSSGGGKRESRWNCTEVYRREGGSWRIVQTHWSLTGAGSGAAAGAS